MICASVMLAIYLGWPLAFGGANRSLEGRAEAHVVVATAKPTPVSRPTVPVQTQPESCYKRFQREGRLCDGNVAAACKLGAADKWDMCEATGFWPE